MPAWKVYLRKPWVWVLLLGVIIGIFMMTRQSGLWGNGTSPAVVAVAKARAVHWQDQFEVTGVVNAMSGIMLKSEVAGRVAKLYFHSGQHTQVGQPLIELNQSILKAQLDQSIANKAQLNNNYDRLNELYKHKVASRAELEKALAASRANDAAIAAVQAQLAQTLIRAPFSGKLGLRQVELGDYVSPGAPLVNLQNLRTLRIDFSVPEAYVAKVHVGDRVQVHSDAYPDAALFGTVYATDSAIIVDTRSLGVRAKLNNSEEKLLPGMFVKLTVLSGAPKEWVAVPQTALNYSTAGTYIYRVQDNKASKVFVTLGPRVDNDILLTKGIQAGDSVVTGGQMKIFDQGPVIPKDA